MAVSGDLEFAVADPRRSRPPLVGEGQHLRWHRAVAKRSRAREDRHLWYVELLS